jgi:hypothetical protein
MIFLLFETHCIVNATWEARRFSGLRSAGKRSSRRDRLGVASPPQRRETACQGVAGLRDGRRYHMYPSLNSAILTRVINGRPYVLEYPIFGDVALIKAERGDRWGNLTYRKAARNFGPVMATAAKRTIASVYEIAELGGFDPEAVVTPGIHVSAIVRIPRVATQAGGFKDKA